MTDQPKPTHQSDAIERVLPAPPPKPVATDAEALKRIADILNGGMI